MKRIIVTWILLIAITLVGAISASAQGFGQLLEAVDKIESNLKELVKKEAQARSQDMARLRLELKAVKGQTSAGDQSPRLAELAGLIAEMELLRSELNSLKNSGVTGPRFASTDNEAAMQIAFGPNGPESETSLLDGRSQSRFGSSPPSRANNPGPKYNNLRFNDNYNYLNDPSNRGKDVFDPLKRISLGGNSSITFGGSYRFRYESDNNRKLGSGVPPSQEVYLNRIFLFSDLQISQRLRLFTEFKYAGIRNNQTPAGATAHDRPDIENLFVDGWFVSNNSFKFGARVGRQELQYGKQRLISPLDWANTRRTFDGFKLMSEFSGWSIDGFVTRPVKVDPKELNSADSDLMFSGLYSSKKLHGNTLSGYLLVYNKDGASGDFRYLTLGTGYDGKAGRFDWSSEMAYQFGSVGDKDVSAYMLAFSGGYLYKEHPWKPRVGFSWDLASGDSDPNDNKVGTFHQHFPLGHAYFGWADQVGRRNINSISVQLSAKPSKTVVMKLNWFSFNLARKKDALYNAGGKVSRQDVTGASGGHVGNELDALIILKLSRHASFHVGYLHFAPGSFLANTGTAESHNMLYMMLPVKF